MMYLHCADCIKELPKGESPESYARLSVALLDNGVIRVHCVRHDKPVVDLDPEKLKGMAQPACAMCAEKEN